MNDRGEELNFYRDLEKLIVRNPNMAKRMVLFISVLAVAVHALVLGIGLILGW
jgi:hypothetical protein